MAGHSKWANIKHRKGKLDAQKGKVFTKIARELMVASKHGGPDPEGNSTLKLAIQKAKEANMPNDNINRAIQKGSGNADGVDYEETRYEGYGPEGIAILMKILTDNRNRTASEIRYILSKNNGNLGETGCVGWIFENKGLITFDLGSMEEEDLMLQLIEAGAEDFTIEDNIVEVVTEVDKFSTVKGKLEEEGIKFNLAEVTMLPQNRITINDVKTAAQVMKLIDQLEDNDDVQEVYANYDIPDEIMEKI